MSRTIRAPRGTEISCKGWLQEAALRMLMNNLDPEVAEDPEHHLVALKEYLPSSQNSLRIRPRNAADRVENIARNLECPRLFGQQGRILGGQIPAFRKVARRFPQGQRVRKRIGRDQILQVTGVRGGF